MMASLAPWDVAGLGESATASRNRCPILPSNESRHLAAPPHPLGWPWQLSDPPNIDDESQPGFSAGPHRCIRAGITTIRASPVVGRAADRESGLPRA
jgi:hypothetical protein